MLQRRIPDALNTFNMLISDKHSQFASKFQNPWYNKKHISYAFGNAVFCSLL